MTKRDDRHEKLMRDLATLKLSRIAEIYRPAGLCLAGLPLTFAISHATHGLTALVSAVVGGGSVGARVGGMDGLGLVDGNDGAT